MRTLIAALLFGLIYCNSFTQTAVSITQKRNVFDEKGDFYFNKGQYEKAIAYYNMAYKKDADNFYSVLRKAEAYTELELFPQAEECFRLVFASNQRLDNIFRLKYAIVLLSNNKHAKAAEWIGKYNQYIEENIEGGNYISTADSRVKLYKDSTFIIVRKLNEINSIESEVAAAFLDNELIFSSSRKSADPSEGGGSYSFYVANYNDAGRITSIGSYNHGFNSAQNESGISLSSDGMRFFVTRSGANNRNLQAFDALIPQSNTEQVNLSPITIQGFNGSIGYPVLNSNGTTMYFVSDAPGGSGGLDLYKCKLEGNQWKSPENLGSTINTSGNESYPSLLNDTVLFFSSDGHNGKGGYDIFSVNLKYANKIVKGLGGDINTSSDDFNLVLINGGNTGYFSSNRPGGKGKEDIYIAGILDLKLRYEGYKHKQRTSMEDGKINLYVSNGDEYNIAQGDNGFAFGFYPNDNYKIVIQKENIKAEDILDNYTVSKEQQEKVFLNPPAAESAEIILHKGMKYLFTSGNEAISPEYKAKLDQMAGEYQADAISLTALAKEMQFDDGEIYTIKFVKDDDKVSYKSNKETMLYINGEEINLYNRAFFIVLPLKSETTFNLQTDLEALEESFNPKKYSLAIDDGPVFKAASDGPWLVSMVVNTENVEDVLPANRFQAEEISFIPSSEYLLTLSKPDPESENDIEIIVPLTRGVKYNLTSTKKGSSEYKEALAEFIIGRDGLELVDEEVIDISILSKELEIEKGEDLSFTLMPVKNLGNKPSNDFIAKSRLTLDDKVFDISRLDVYTINVPFVEGQNVKIQTDLEYLKNNFSSNTYTMNLDTAGFFTEIEVDTTGYGELKKKGWLVSMNVNTESANEVEIRNQLMAKEVSIIPGKEYILTVSKVDAETGEEDEIIVPLTRKVKYDFTANPMSEEEYKKSLEKFIKGQEEIETVDGELIDIKLLSKELKINEGDKVSFSLLPVKSPVKNAPKELGVKSSLFLDNKIVEFTHIQKYTINVPLVNDGKMNLHSDVVYIEENFDPGTFTLDVDTLGFFSEILVDTTGYGDRVFHEEEITDPVYDVVIVNFELNKYDLTPTALKIIREKVVDELKDDNRLYVTIKGYTDALGDADYNEKLSKNRAESVKDFLSKNGIGEERIRTFSFGESKALADGVDWEDLTEEELKKHRKVEIVIYLPE